MGSPLAGIKEVHVYRRCSWGPIYSLRNFYSKIRTMPSFATQTRFGIYHYRSAHLRIMGGNFVIVNKTLLAKSRYFIPDSSSLSQACDVFGSQIKTVSFNFSLLQLVSINWLQPKLLAHLWRVIPKELTKIGALRAVVCHSFPQSSAKKFASYQLKLPSPLNFTRYPLKLQNSC